MPSASARRKTGGMPGHGYNPRMQESVQITFNGEPMRLEAATTLAELLERTHHARRRIAVEINQAIVPRSLHATHRLADGDRVEVVTAFGGG
jgi:sulfur carrier protein